MSIHRNILLTTALLTGFALPLLAQDVSSDTVVATVNGADITVGHMILTREALPDQYQSLPDEVLFEGVLDQLIQQVVLSQSLVGGDSKRVIIALENERRSLLAGEVLDTTITAALTDTAIKEAYDAAYANVEPATEYNASHILVETEDEAKNLLTSLGEGVVFADLAKEKSTGPSGVNGGELGWFGTGMMVKDFEDAVLVLNKGDVSEPIKTRFGWHVIILNDTRLTEAPKLEDVRAELEAEIKQSAIAAIITTLTDKADVVKVEDGAIPTSVLSNLSLIDN